ncbi:hypothetical protein E4U42_003373 [Claviceps africana]|uniref:SWIM-type domain-containing protein n=1 Tax=Claviceps africana TaxID=83212 RepID=A0A8K0NJ23_9HYPO|nr:hypothetical protein E4U42_003373 [Claviceps africana]
MAAGSGSLPTHQQLLSSLVASLSSEPGECSVPQTDDAQRQPHQLDRTSRRRTLLLTLHVLFPSLVLPALELVDNQLVTKLQVRDQDACRDPGPIKTGDDGGGKECLLSPGKNNGLHVVSGPQAPPSAYAVQSSASSRSLGRQLHADALSKVHIVHLAAWNCSCNDFHRNKFFRQVLDDGWSTRASNACSPGSNGNPGASLLPCASVDEKNVPCCKHLLACLIVERLTGSQAKSTGRVFSKSEIATLIAGLQQS